MNRTGEQYTQTRIRCQVRPYWKRTMTKILIRGISRKHLLGSMWFKRWQSDCILPSGKVL